jgi:BMFP domain-containing protein YqiC
MQSRNPLFDDMARVASGAASVFGGVREEFESFFRQQFERILAEMDLVTREEFDAVKAMAANARSEQEALQKRVADLEARLAKARPSPAKPAKRRRTTAKTSAKASSAKSAKTGKAKATTEPAGE